MFVNMFEYINVPMVYVNCLHILASLLVNGSHDNEMTMITTMMVGRADIVVMS